MSIDSRFFTLTKREILARLAHLDDGDKIYIQTTKADVRAAEAAVAPEQTVLTFGVTRDIINEADGLSLVAYFPK